MEHKKLKSALAKINAAEYMNAWQLIENNAEIITGEPIRIIVMCCHGLDKHEFPEQNEYDHLLKILSALSFEGLQQNLLKPHLDSMLFIVKTFLDNNKIDGIMCIKKHIFETLTSLSKAPREFQKIIIMLHNKLVAQKKYNESVFDLSCILTQLIIAVEEDLSSVVRYVQFLHSIQTPVLNMYKYFETLQHCQFSDLTYAKYGKPLITIASHLCKALFTANKHKEVKKVLNKITQMLEHTDGIKAIEIVSDVLFLITSDDAFPENFTALLTDTIKKLKIASQTKLKLYIEDISLLMVNCLKINEMRFKNSDDLNAYLQFCKCLSEIISDMKVTCCCKIYYDVHNCIKALLLVTNVATCIFKSEQMNSVDDNLYGKIASLYIDTCRHANVLKLHDCTRFNNTWQSLSYQFYNFLVQLYNAKIIHGKMFIQKFLMIIYKTEGEGSKLCAQLLVMLSEYYSNDGQHDYALKFIALNIVLHGAHPKSQWLTVKSRLNESYWPQTVVKVYTENISFYKQLYSNIKMPTIDQRKCILISELNGYIERWPKRACISFILIELYENTSPIDFGKAVISVALNHITTMPEAFVKILLKCLESMKTDTKEAKIIKACLEYIYFKNKTAQITSQTYSAQKDKPVIDPLYAASDTCDLENYSPLLRHLYSALELFETGISKSIKIDIISLLKEMAMTFQAQNFTSDALRSWKLVLKLAQMKAESDNIIEACGFILRLLNCDHEDFQSTLTIANKFLSFITSHSICCLYYTNLCFSYILNGKIDLFKKYFEVATSHYYELDQTNGSEKVDTIRANYMLLEAQLLNVPCEHSIDKHEDFTLVKPYLAYKVLTSYLNFGINKASQFALFVYWEVIDFTLYVAVTMSWTRELNCYSNDNIKFAQEYLFPLRAARLLIYQAKCHVLTFSLDDCTATLGRLSDLLAIKCAKVDILTENFEQLCVRTAEPLQTNSGSPILYTEPIKLPGFLKHSPNCDCIPCRNTEYFKIFLEKMNIEAMLAEGRKNYSTASAYYRIIFDLIKEIQMKENDTSPYFFCLESTCNAVLLDYIKHKIRKNDVATAILLNQNLLLSLKHGPRVNYGLYNDALSVQLKLLCIESQEIVQKEQSPTKTPDKLTPTFDFKTPKVLPLKMESCTRPKFKIYTPVSTKSEKTAPKSLANPKVIEKELSPKVLRKINTLVNGLNSAQKAIDDDAIEKKVRTRRAVRKNLMAEMEEPIQNKGLRKKNETATSEDVLKLMEIIESADNKVQMITNGEVEKKDMPAVVISNCDDETKTRTRNKKMINSRACKETGAVPKTTRRKL